LKIKIAKKVPDVQTSPVKTVSKKEIAKEREFMQSPKTPFLTMLEYRRWCARFTIDDTFITQP
jgi:hypothetical protein